jgi:hypothetical protein
MRRLAWLAVLVPTLPPLAASADDKKCIDAQFTPADGLQMVAWLETASGQFYDTIYITQETGTFGLGNRPGRFDFNSGPMWPYGRRITVFPVWSHRNGEQFPTVLFRSDSSEDPNYCFPLTGNDSLACAENDLSHAFSDSSRENHFCRPLLPHEPSWDAMTCATTAFTDKGRFSATATTGYPPRADLVRSSSDSASVDMYKMLNPYDAVSQPTPLGGMMAHAAAPVPPGVAGDYVLYVEVSAENDFNATYNQTSYPSPTMIQWNMYGQAYRGQPSVVYRVPFTIADTKTTAETLDYAGYGDPDGNDGTIRPPDATITTDTPGAGASRLELVSDGADMYRLRVTVSPYVPTDLPGTPDMLQAAKVTSSGSTLTFVAPGVGPDHIKVTGYEIRIRANDPITDANFDASMPVSVHVAPDAPGAPQSFDLMNLLPETDYSVGIRAYDGCHNTGALAIVNFTTGQRVNGSVDACFVATAAYGSLMANDVELLRHFRDSVLETNVLGELGVEAYYTFGPAAAAVIGESDLLRTSARGALRPLIARVRGLSVTSP